MKAQHKPYSCGIASICNALEVVGIIRTQREVMSLCLCTPAAGTPEDEMLRGLLACGAGVDEVSFTRRDDAEDWLHVFLDDHGPVILCVDEWEHYVTVIGRAGKGLVVFDPANGAGLRVYTIEGLLTRWRLARAKGGPNYYGIGVSA